MYAVIPQPLEMTVGKKTVFTLTEKCNLTVGEGCEKAESALKKFLGDIFSLSLNGGDEETVVLKISGEVTANEGYVLSVKDKLVEIIGADSEGVFYGVQTLKQLLFQGKLSLCEVSIKDSPRFPYRGFMLDCGRYFFPKKDIFTFLEMMALHKLNTFHWHLSEDQGFRAEIPEKPLLAKIGSKRTHTNFNRKEHKGFYTVEDMKEVVEYAHSLHIKVIPEIDTPGHVVSMIAAYPELSCFDRKLPVATHCGVKHDVLCIGKESTFAFMEKVYDSLLEIFTDGVFHLGGDEVPVTRWKVCPHCQKRMKDEGISDVSGLHTYYLDRVASYLKEKGTKAIMWNDTPKEHMVSKDVAWQFWNTDMSPEDAVREINKGRPFIISSVNSYYLDIPYGIVNLKRTYEFEPEYEGIKEENKHLLTGVEACLWTEFVPDMKKADYCTYPRLGAYSEAAWSDKKNRSYNRFTEKLPVYEKLLRSYGINPAPLKRAMPDIISKIGGIVYWERRKLCWEGLHNLIDNAKVKYKYSK